MYTRCFHCLDDLGRNDVLERFPVSQLVAFDPQRGHLWAVCAACARWNLAPLETRWEAVEDCERQFHRVRTRLQSPHIGMAVLPGRFRLIRIGTPSRREYAAWRYGTMFAKAGVRVRAFLETRTLVPALIDFIALFLRARDDDELHAFDAIWPTPDSVAARAVLQLPRGPGRSWEIMASGTILLPGKDGALTLSAQHHSGRTEFTGTEAEFVLRLLLRQVNRAGALPETINAAVARLDPHDPAEVLRALADETARTDAAERVLAGDQAPAIPLPSRLQTKSVGRIIGPRRLALEMALHAATEQRAVEGELTALTAAWREASEIAGIADTLVQSDAVSARLRDLKDRQP